MKSNELNLRNRPCRNSALALYIAGVTVFMTVYTTLTLTQYL